MIWRLLFYFIPGFVIRSDSDALNRLFVAVASRAYRAEERGR